jgi:DNA-binding GntR family transcriptional regulator
MPSSAKNRRTVRQPLAAAAYEAIVRKIICLDYQPGQRLEENLLVEELGIGRTPVREALVRLQGENMIESHPNKGVVVRPLTLQNTKSMFESMQIFELGAADLAMTRDCSDCIRGMRLANEAVKQAILSNDIFELVEANHRFHMAFAECTRNEFLIRAITHARNESKRLAYLSYNRSIDPRNPLEHHYRSVVQEHDQITGSLEKKDGPGLKQLLKEHIETFRQRIILFMTQ